MVFRLTLIAHAATEATHAARFAAPCDELSRAGRGAAQRLADSGELPREPGDQLVLCAPELRAQQTAKLLGYGDAQAEESFADLDLGEWAGRGVDEIPAADLYSWNTDPEFRGHAGETVAAACGRIGAALDALGEGERGSAVVIAHPSTLRSAVIHCLSAPAQTFFRVDAGPGHALGLHRRGWRWTLRL